MPSYVLATLGVALLVLCMASAMGAAFYLFASLPGERRRYGCGLLLILVALVAFGAALATFTATIDRQSQEIHDKVWGKPPR